MRGLGIPFKPRLATGGDPPLIPLGYSKSFGAPKITQKTQNLMLIPEISITFSYEHWKWVKFEINDNGSKTRFWRLQEGKS